MSSWFTNGNLLYKDTLYFLFLEGKYCPNMETFVSKWKWEISRECEICKTGKQGRGKVWMNDPKQIGVKEVFQCLYSKRMNERCLLVFLLQTYEWKRSVNVFTPNVWKNEVCQCLYFEHMKERSVSVSLLQTYEWKEFVSVSTSSVWMEEVYQCLYSKRLSERSLSVSLLQKAVLMKEI